MAAITPTDGRKVAQGDAIPVVVENESPNFVKAGITRTTITCTLANTDYPVGAAIPAGTVRIQARAVTNDAVLANEVTDASKGLWLVAGYPYLLRVTPGDTLHAQSPNAGTVVRISYLSD